jgi:phosphate transport system substrate-binding protein
MSCRALFVRILFGLAFAASTACSGGATGAEGGASSADVGQINGAGATFPYVIYSKWFDEFHRLHPEARINYQSQGSGAGIRQLTSETVFFGASDGPMTLVQMAAAPGPILHLPTVLGANVPVYNVPNVTAELKFTGTLLADIFLGRVTKWNDPAIASINAGVALPADDITVVHRSDGSGTTYIWADYLSKVSPEWKSRVGVSTSPNWPTGVGAKGNEGVAGLIVQTPGSIGYLELIYALQNKMTYGSVRNAAGEFVLASEESVTEAAAAAVDQMPSDFRVSITDPPGAGAYPISSFTWLLLYENPADTARSKVTVDFMKWALIDGQKLAGPLGYAPLPPRVVELELAALGRIKTS